VARRPRLHLRSDTLTTLSPLPLCFSFVTGGHNAPAACPCTSCRRRLARSRRPRPLNSASLGHAYSVLLGAAMEPRSICGLVACSGPIGRGHADSTPLVKLRCPRWRCGPLVAIGEPARPSSILPASCSSPSGGCQHSPAAALRARSTPTALQLPAPHVGSHDPSFMPLGGGHTPPAACKA
jgi:hypothetical protein